MYVLIENFKNRLLSSVVLISLSHSHLIHCYYLYTCKSLTWIICIQKDTYFEHDKYSSFEYIRNFQIIHIIVGTTAFLNSYLEKFIAM